MKTTTHLFKLKLAPSLAVAALGLAFSSFAHAATYTVNSTADAADAIPGNGVCETSAGNGVCTLRAALQEAANGDTINFSVTGTIVPASVLPVNTSVTITGPGASNLSINPAFACQIFNVNGTATTVTISGLTLAQGFATQGGAIENRSNVASLTVTNCVISNNSANAGAGISNETLTGTLTVTGCTFSANDGRQQGGAINNATARAGDADE